MKSFSNYIIDTRAILYNISQFKKINSSTKICAVVKADGYGLGINNFIKEIEHKVDYFAVACYIEAKKLRKYTKKPILVLNFVPVKNLTSCVENNISITIYNYNQIKQVSKKIKKGKIKVHFAINTGMNRIGFNNIQEFVLAYNKTKKAKNIECDGIFTHFFNATNNKDTQKQACIFKQFVSNIKDDNIIIHTSASDASFLYKNYNFDMVRLGICLYGESNAKVKLKPVLTITSKIINLTQIKKGQSVGYGKSFIAKKDMFIATVPLGYADGIMRAYAKNGKVIINNKYCKIVGNICMDMFMCDVSGIKSKIGDTVILIGKNIQDKKITVSEVAKKCNTISYEILTNIKRSRFNVIKK